MAYFSTKHELTQLFIRGKEGSEYEEYLLEITPEEHNDEFLFHQTVHVFYVMDCLY